MLMYNGVGFGSEMAILQDARGAWLVCERYWSPFICTHVTELARKLRFRSQQHQKQTTSSHVAWWILHMSFRMM